MKIHDIFLIEKAYAQSATDTEASCKTQYGVFFDSFDTICKCKGDQNKSVACTDPAQQTYMQEQTTIRQNTCNTTLKYSTRSKNTNSCECESGDKTADGKECLVNSAGTLGIQCDATQLINNTCSRNINKTLGIRQSDPTPNPTLLLQDVVLGATSFVGTLLMISLVYLGGKAVLAGAGDSDELGNIKGKIKDLAIGLLLVIGSYSIIRVIQYLAKGY